MGGAARGTPLPGRWIYRPLSACYPYCCVLAEPAHTPAPAPVPAPALLHVTCMSCRSARASSAASGRTSGSKAPWSSCCTRTRPRRAARATCRRTRWSSTAAISSSHPSTATHAFGRPERAHLCSRAWCDSCRRAKKYCADAVSDGAFVVTLRSVVGVSLSLKVLTRTYELYLRFTAQVQRKFEVARMHSGGSTVFGSTHSV